MVKVLEITSYMNNNELLFCDEYVYTYQNNSHLLIDMNKRNYEIDFLSMDKYYKNSKITDKLEMLSTIIIL